MSRIIKVLVRNVIFRLRVQLIHVLVTPAWTLIILDMTKTSSHNCLVFRLSSVILNSWVWLVNLTEKFHFDHVWLPNKSSNSLIVVLLIIGPVLFSWPSRRIYFFLVPCPVIHVPFRHKQKKMELVWKWNICCGGRMQILIFWNLQ